MAETYVVKLLASESKKAKGISVSVVKKHITVLDYREIVDSGGLFSEKCTFPNHLSHNMANVGLRA